MALFLEQRRIRNGLKRDFLSVIREHIFTTGGIRTALEIERRILYWGLEHLSLLNTAGNCLSQREDYIYFVFINYICISVLFSTSRKRFRIAIGYNMFLNSTLFFYKQLQIKAGVRSCLIIAIIFTLQ